MKVNGTIVVEDIAYSIGSTWAPIPSDTATFEIFNNVTGTQVAADSFTPPEAPFVFTNFLIGLGNVSSGSTFATRAVPLIDAPES